MDVPKKASKESGKKKEKGEEGKKSLDAAEAGGSQKGKASHRKPPRVVTRAKRNARNVRTKRAPSTITPTKQSSSSDSSPKPASGRGRNSASSADSTDFNDSASPNCSGDAFAGANASDIASASANAGASASASSGPSIVVTESTTATEFNRMVDAAFWDKMSEIKSPRDRAAADDDRDDDDDGTPESLPQPSSTSPLVDGILASSSIDELAAALFPGADCSVLIISLDVIIGLLAMFVWYTFLYPLQNMPM